MDQWAAGDMLNSFSSAFIFCFALASGAHAQGCPDFFRFVDFGLEGRDGITYRGGPVLRAEGFSGEPLMLRTLTECVDVPQMATDGHGNPIPVVSSVVYDPERTGVDLNELRVAITKDAVGAAEDNAIAHRALLNRSTTLIVRGANFLCARSDGSGNPSCQVHSPFSGTAPLVIHCDAVTCRMPVMAMNDQIFASAVWPVDPAFFEDTERLGADVVTQVQKIHDFLRPISSAL